MLGRAVESMLLSGRGADRARRVATTIAALDGAESVGADHMAEALSFRGQAT
jgi:magnesium chelatase family protein